MSKLVTPEASTFGSQEDRGNLDREALLWDLAGQEDYRLEGLRRGQARDSGLKGAGRLLCRGWATATLRELSARFGLTHPDRASDLIGRGKRSAKSNRDVARQVASVEQALGLNPESRA